MSDQAKAERRTGAKGAGQSGGGAYPNPHRGKDGKSDGYMGHGGRTGMEYHGTGRLGGEDGRGQRQCTRRGRRRLAP